MIRYDSISDKFVDVGPGYDCGVKLAREIVEAVNDFAASGRDFKLGMADVLTREHRTLQQNTMRFVRDVIEIFASIDDNETDDRNKNAVALARMLNNAIRGSSIGLPNI